MIYPLKNQCNEEEPKPSQEENRKTEKCPRYQDLYHKKNKVKILGRAVFCLSGRPL